MSSLPTWRITTLPCRTLSMLQVIRSRLHRCVLSGCSGLSLHLCCCLQLIWGIQRSCSSKEEYKTIMRETFGWCPGNKGCSRAKVLLLLLAVFLASLVVRSRISTSNDSNILWTLSRGCSTEPLWKLLSVSSLPLSGCASDLVCTKC